MLAVLLDMGLFAIAVLILIGLTSLERYHRERAQYRPHLFTPLDASQFAPKMAEYVARLTPEIEDLGYLPLGDYLQRELPLRIAARYFIRWDGKSLAEIADVGGTLGCEIWSVFENGTCLLSAQACVRKLRYNREQMILFNHLPGASVGELDASHWQRAAEYGTATGFDLLAFSPGDLREVTEYPRRLSRWNLYQRGLIPEPPQAPGEKKGTSLIIDSPPPCP